MVWRPIQITLQTIVAYQFIVSLGSWCEMAEIIQHSNLDTENQTETTPSDKETSSGRCINGNQHRRNIEGTSQLYPITAACNNFEGFTGDFDELLTLVGEFGPFQWKLYLYLQLPFIFLGFIYLSQIWLVLEPEHWCSVPELTLRNFSVETIKRISIPRDSDSIGQHQSQCFMYDIDYTREDILAWLPANDTPVIPCRSGWTYNFSIIYPTIVSELDWVCDNSWKATLSSGIFFIGAFFGTSIFSYLSDRYGRVPILIVTNVLACFSGVLSAYSFSLTMFATTRFVYGMAYNTQFTQAMVLISEFVGPRYRSMVINVPLATTLCLTMVAMPWMAKLLGHWKWMALATSLPTALVLLYLLLDVPESCRWLLQRGELDTVIEKMKHIAAVNGRNVEAHQWQAFTAAARKSQEQIKSQPVPSLLDLLGYPFMLRRAILLTFCTMVVLLSFDLVVRNTKLDTDIYTGQSLLALSEAPADLLTWLLLETMGRRWTSTASMVGCAVLAFAEFCLLQQHSPNVAFTSIVVVFVCRCFCTVGVNTVLQQCIELFPTDIRARGFGLTQVASMLSVAASPFILHLDSWMHGLPLLLLCAFALISAAALSFLPETKGYRLPETLPQGERFGRDQSYLQCYCITGNVEDSKPPPDVHCYDNSAMELQ